jgi:DNA-binding phage protein
MNINWQTVTLNLRLHYKPLSQVAKEVGSDWRHLNRLARGEVNQPRFDTAMRLLDLHYDVCRSKHREVLI